MYALAGPPHYAVKRGKREYVMGEISNLHGFDTRGLGRQAGINVRAQVLDCQVDGAAIHQETVRKVAKIS